MLAIRRRNDQTARISLLHPQMSKNTRTKTRQPHHNNGATNQNSPQKFPPVLPPATVAVSPASGDALLTEGRRSPQEEKDSQMTFFSQCRRYRQDVAVCAIFTTSIPAAVPENTRRSAQARTVPDLPRRQSQRSATSPAAASAYSTGSADQTLTRSR
jgi:hypothetical protein